MELLVFNTAHFYWFLYIQSIGSLRENALELYKLKKVGDYFERSE